MDATPASPSGETKPMPVLPEGFQIRSYLEKADAESNILRVVARVLGEDGGDLMIDTAEGVYAVPCVAVRRLQYLDDDTIFVIDIDPATTCVLHTTARRLIRTRTGTFPSGSSDELLGEPRWADEGPPPQASDLV